MSTTDGPLNEIAGAQGLADLIDARALITVMRQPQKERVTFHPDAFSLEWPPLTPHLAREKKAE